MSVLKKLTVGALASGGIKNFDLRLDNDLEKYLPLDMLLVSSTDTALNVTVRLDNSDMKAFKLVKNNSKRVKGVPFSSITIVNDGAATIVAGNLMCEVGLLPAEVEMSAMEAVDLTGNATVETVAVDRTFYSDTLTKLVGDPPAITGVAGDLVKDKILLDRNLAQVTGTADLSEDQQVTVSDTGATAATGQTVYKDVVADGNNIFSRSITLTGRCALVVVGCVMTQVGAAYVALWDGSASVGTMETEESGHITLVCGRYTVVRDAGTYTFSLRAVGGTVWANQGRITITSIKLA